MVFGATVIKGVSGRLEILDLRREAVVEWRVLRALSLIILWQFVRDKPEEAIMSLATED